MRLIDGDALYKELNAIRKEEVLLHGRSNNKDCCTLSTALYEIEHAPTIEPEQKWETCFDCPLSNGCPKIRGCTNEQAEGYASDIPDDCPLSIDPERKKDTVQKFHDYQVEWLLSHCDLELEPQLEEWVVHFLHDTANCYMMEIDRKEGE